MDSNIGSMALQFVQNYVLPPVGAGLLGLIGVLMAQWQARAKVAAARSNLLMAHTNADAAVKAVEQLYPNDPPEVKKAKALALAQEMNCLAKIVIPDEVQTNMNEAKVLGLPPVVKPPVSSAPTGTTIDEQIPKALG
jgi:hypothetical protein